MTGFVGIFFREDSSSGEESGDDDMDMDGVTVNQDIKVSKHDLLVKGEVR